MEYDLQRPAKAAGHGFSASRSWEAAPGKLSAVTFFPMIERIAKIPASDYCLPASL